MDDTILNYDVRHNDLSVVDEDLAISDVNGNCSSLDGGKNLAILQISAVTDSTLDDVVCE